MERGPKETSAQIKRDLRGQRQNLYGHVVHGIIPNHRVKVPKKDCSKPGIDAHWKTDPLTSLTVFRVALEPRMDQLNESV